MSGVAWEERAVSLWGIEIGIVLCYHLSHSPLLGPSCTSPLSVRIVHHTPVALLCSFQSCVLIRFVPHLLLSQVGAFECKWTLLYQQDAFGPRDVEDERRNPQKTGHGLEQQNNLRILIHMR